MKVAVTTIEPSLDSAIDERFGRAMHFLIVDTETMESDVIDNAVNRNAMQGAGIASAELVTSHGAVAVITGHLGPKAFAALDAAGVKGYGAAGMTARAAIEAFVAGTLQELSEGEPRRGR